MVFFYVFGAYKVGVALNCALHHAVSNYESVCAVHLGVRRGVFTFELNLEHSAWRSRGKFFCSHVEEDVHKSNQVFTW